MTWIAGCTRVPDTLDGMGFLRRRVITALLTANAVKPPPPGNFGPVGFALGWPTNELAPQLLALTALDTAQAVIRGKASLRAIHQAHIRLDDVRVPLDAVLPGTKSFKDASTVLYATRSGVAWSALGHATACYEAALAYAKERVQFGKPLAKFQMVQERLTHMLEDLTAMQLYCRRLADLEAAGALRPTQASLAKFHNTRTARDIARTARDLLGGNGILLENRVMQHLADIEAIHTYEGTESIQALLIGRDITGMSAFA